MGHFLGQCQKGNKMSDEIMSPLSSETLPLRRKRVIKHLSKLRTTVYTEKHILSLWVCHLPLLYFLPPFFASFLTLFSKNC